jgi:hypothetical protein
MMIDTLRYFKNYDENKYNMDMMINKQVFGI